MYEVWKPVIGHEGRYEASNHGQIRGLLFISKARPMPRIKKLTLKSTGYLSVRLQYEHHWVHRVVCAAFHGPCPDGLECAHLNGNRLDNRAENLRWVTTKENVAHMKSHGTLVCGENHRWASLSERDVFKIREMYTGKYGEQTALARKFGVTQTTIWSVVTNRTWKHL